MRVLAAAFVAALAALFVVANLVAARITIYGMPLPNYGIWSGVLEIEQKMRLLEDFAGQGPVDALILSSSMGDLGVSAETLTQELSARHGRPFRVFNFGIGGADIPTYPILYRIARMVAKPRQVWVVAPVSSSRPKITPGSLDEKLFKGPVGRYDRVPGLLWLSWKFYELPVIRFAPALRDAAVYRTFKNRPITNLDIYDIDRFGDTVSWLYNVDAYEAGTKRAIDRRDEILLFLREPNDVERRKHMEIYLNPRGVAAIDELREDVRSDGASLTIVPFDHAVALAFHDAEFMQGGQRYFDALAKRLDAPLVDARPDFEVAPYMISDPTHLNVIGAREFARVLADRFANSPVPPPTRYEVDEKIRDRLPDKTWSSFSALITKRKDDPSATLELHYLQTWGLAILHENSDLQVEVRLPDGRDVALPTRVLSSGFAEADASALPLADRDVVLRIQLGARSGNVGQPLSIPLAYYSWSKERHEPAFYARRTTATVQPEKTVYSALEPVRVKWSGIKEPSRLDWVGIFPAGDERALRRTFKVTGGASSGEMEMQPMFYPGKYDLRLFRDNNWDLLATSEPFEVVAMAGSLAISQASIAAGSTLDVRWSALNYPNAKDWIAVFPRGFNDVVIGTQTKTAGAASGEARITIPPATKPGEYEVRLYSSGGWTLLSSQPLTVRAP